jgi:microcystin-dependent protein
VNPAAAGGTIPTTASPLNAFWGAEGTTNTFNTAAASAPGNTLYPSVIATAGANQPHENRPPYLVLNFCICLSGIFPSRN